MKLFQRWFAGRGERLEKLASEIAERAVAEVSRRLNVTVSSMSQAEAKGYVRARAARPVRQQMEFVLASGPMLSAEQSREILARATEQTVTLVVREVVKGSPEKKTRRAA